LKNGLTLEILLKYLSAGVSLLEIGPDIQVVYLSDGFYQMTGAGKMPVPCRLEKIGIHPDYKQEYEMLLRQTAASGETKEHVHRIAGKAGKWIWRSVKIVRIDCADRYYPVVLELSEDISELMEKERSLRESNERLRVAFHQTPHRMWEVDIKARTFNQYNMDEQCCSRKTVIGDFPETLLKNKTVHPESADDFLKFAEKLLSGEDAGNENFIMRDPSNNCYDWVSLSYRMTYDRDGMPDKAVGVQEKLPGLSGIGAGIFPRRPLPEVMRRHLLVRMKVNLTADYVAEIWAEGSDKTAWSWGRSYSEIISMERSRWFARMEENKFQKRFLRKRLLKDFQEGKIWSTEEYRRIDAAGNIRWTSDLVNLVEDPKTHSVYMFACFMDTQKRHDWEVLAGKECSRSQESGLYDFATAKQIVNTLIGHGGDADCALSIIRIEGKTWFQENAEESRKTMEYISAALSLILGVDCIVSAWRSDSVFVFFPQAGARFDLKRRIEDAFAYLRVSMNDLPGMCQLRFVAGTVIDSIPDADLESMMIRAEYLCKLWKDAAMDTAAFPAEDEDWIWAGLQTENRESSILTDSCKTERPLNEKEQKAAFQCMTEMLRACSVEKSISGVLGCIGKYYGASRTYLLLLSDDQETVTMTHEWMAGGRQSISHIVSGIRLKKFPLLIRCMKEKKPIFLEQRQGNDGISGWNFTVFPMAKEEITGFLCVENGEDPPRDAVLVMTLMPYIQEEKRRFEILSGQRKITGEEGLSRLPNLNSYMKTVHSLNSDIYSSMGALSVDVPEYSALNSRYGFEYGKKLLTYIADMLKSIFGKAFIFRTWDAEFVVLYPNTIQEVFVSRCTRLYAILQRRYPKQTRIGYVWSEGVFQARNLVKEAQSIMRSEKQIPSGSRQSFCNQEISWKKFVPYFQPKIDMRSGKLIGAEALVRGIDKKGNILFPDQFIEKFEKDGSIRELDLFMIESVLRQLSQWKDRGIPDLKISVNISRITLFQPTALASILALQSRYPEIETDQIELEITETAGEIEKDSLARIVNDFRECGIGFELDDFGSGYANISVFSNIKFNAVKLDRSLINDLPGNEISRILVENITQICENFDMQCVAEGVETEEQREVLLQAGCIYGQGFYYAKPLPAGEFEKRYFKPAEKGRMNHEGGTL
jgi:EAL domain-containing protein (putative c-di-GMP-specific phosphodiesterase class I)/GGDEF domain-containing protein/PAS domain-containing protein